MTVEEIKAKLPEAEVYALTPMCRYIVVYDMNAVSRRDAQELADELYSKHGISVYMVGSCIGSNEAIRILEVK